MSNITHTQQAGKVLHHPTFGKEPVAAQRVPRRLPKGVIKGNFRKPAPGQGMTFVFTLIAEEVKA
ncbi:hypothetical protein ACWKWV_00475 [Castellaniella ginsengisoli]